MYGGAFCYSKVVVVVKFWCNSRGRKCIVNSLFLEVFLSCLIGAFDLPMRNYYLTRSLSSLIVLFSSFLLMTDVVVLLLLGRVLVVASVMFVGTKYLLVVLYLVSLW